MPLVVVGAIAAAGAISVGVAVSTVAMVGLAATVVGKVTKSKELSQLGAGLGLGAGIASVATSVFGAGNAVASAGTAEAGSAALENTISSADLAGIDAAAGGVGGSAAAAPGALDIATAWDMPATAIESAGSTGGLSSGSSGTGLLGSSTSAPAAAVTPPAPAQQAAVNAQGAPATPTPATASGAVAPPPATDTNSIAQWWSKQPDAMKSRILQMGGNFAGSLFDGWSAEQKQALQREQMNLEKQKYETAVANGNAQPVVKFQQYKPAATGLLGATRG